jgi:hypothetical protein
MGPMMLTRGFSPSLRTRGSGILPRLAPNSVHSQLMARSADCHWSSSMVRGMKRWMVRPLRRHAAADHLGDRAGHDHCRQVGIERGGGALHWTFGAGLRRARLRRGR